MSFYSFCDKKKLDGVSLISMAWLKVSAVKKLREQGFEVLSCVDNDKAGRKFELDNRLNRATDLLERANVKDWSDLWQLHTNGKLKNEKMTVISKEKR
jgi:hypothetical protein